mgnify:CR=1 FL=1
MSDLFLLLMLAGAGDELQGIKRGIMEMSDIIAITKADGSNVNKATLARALYTNALSLFPPAESGWIPCAITTSAITKEGLEGVLQKIDEYFELTEKNGYYTRNRMEQAKYWMYEAIQEELKNRFFENPAIEKNLKYYESLVLKGEITSFVAATELIKLYNKL